MAFLSLFCAAFSVTSGVLSAVACGYWVNYGRVVLIERYQRHLRAKNNLRKVG